MKIFSECVLDVKNEVPRSMLHEGYKLNTIHEARQALEYAENTTVSKLMGFWGLCASHGLDGVESMQLWDAIKK